MLPGAFTLCEASRPTHCRRAPAPIVIPTEAQPSGGTRLQTESRAQLSARSLGFARDDSKGHRDDTKRNRDDKGR